MESSGEGAEGTEPLEAGFLGMTLTRTLEIWMEGGDERRAGWDRPSDGTVTSMWMFPHCLGIG